MFYTHLSQVARQSAADPVFYTHLSPVAQRSPAGDVFYTHLSQEALRSVAGPCVLHSPFSRGSAESSRSCVLHSPFSSGSVEYNRSCVLHSPFSRGSAECSRSLCFTLTFLQWLCRVQQVPVFYTHLSPVALLSAAGPCVLHSPFSSGSPECSRFLCFTLTFLQWLSGVQQVPVFYTHLSQEALQSAAGPCVLHSPFSIGSPECSRSLCFTLTFLQWLSRVQQVPVFYTHLSPVTVESSRSCVLCSPFSSGSAECSRSCVLHSPFSRGSAESSRSCVLYSFSSGSLECSRYLCFTVTFLQWLCRVQQVPVFYTHLSPVAVCSAAGPCVLHSPFSRGSPECSRSLCFTLTFLQWLSGVQQVPVFYTHLSPVAQQSAAGPCVLHSPFSSGSVECSRSLCFTLTFLQWLSRVQQVPVFYTHLSPVALQSAAGPCVLHSPFSSGSAESGRSLCFILTFLQWLSGVQQVPVFYTHLSPVALQSAAGPCVLHSPFSSGSAECSRSLCFTLTFLQWLSGVQQVLVFYTHLSPVALQSAAGPCVLHSPFSSGSAECSRSLCFTLTFLQWLCRVQQVPVFYTHLSPVALQSATGPST